MPFVKGTSGNPAGRLPVGQTLASALRDRLPVEKLVEVAETLLASDDESIRFKTLQLVFDRAHGKVLTTVEVTGEMSPAQSALLAALQLTPEDRRRRFAELDAEDQAALEAGPLVDDDGE
jgi:hypothetical protein